jgi:hypothetical protein
MEIDRHEANQVEAAADQVEAAANQVESGDTKQVVTVYKDAALIRVHMQDVASEKGARRGKLLQTDKAFPRSSNRIVKRCINTDCNFRMMARKCLKGYTIDEEWSETQHYTLSHDGMRGVCCWAMATMVRALL